MPKVIYSIIIVALLAATVACAGASGKKQTAANPAAEPQVQELAKEVAALGKRVNTLEKAGAAPGKVPPDLDKTLAALDKRVATLEKAETAPGKAPANLAGTLAVLDKRVATLEKADRAATGVPSASEEAFRGLAKRAGAIEQQLEKMDKTVSELKASPSGVPANLASTVELLEKRVATLETGSPPGGKIGSTPTPTPKPEAVLHVGKHNGSIDDARTKLTIAGEVSNLGDAPATSFQLLVTLYRWDGSVMVGKTGTPLVTALGPGVTSPFTISFTAKEVSPEQNFDRYGNYTVTIITGKAK